MEGQWTVEAENAWLAAMIDGEGSVVIGLTKQKSGNLQICTYVQIISTETVLINKVKSIYDRLGCRRTICLSRADRLGTRDVFRITITAYKDLVKLFDAVLPYMVSYKADRAKLMREYVLSRIPHTNHTYTGREIEMANNIRNIKAR